MDPSTEELFKKVDFLTAAKKRVVDYLRVMGIGIGVGCELNHRNSQHQDSYIFFIEYAGYIHVPVAILTLDGKLHFLMFDTVELNDTGKDHKMTRGWI